MVAILQYNMFLTMFCCMLTEAIHLYRMIVVVFGGHRNFKGLYIAVSFGT